MRTQDEIREEIEELKEQIKELEEGENGDDFEEHLDDVFGDVDVCGYKYGSGYVLKNLDPIAFQEGLNNWNDGEITELNDRLQELEDELKEATQ